MMRYQFSKACLSAVLGFCLASPAASWALTPPTAGQMLQQLQAPEAPRAPASKPPALINQMLPSDDKALESTEKINVKQLVFVGNTAFDSAELNRAAGLSNQAVTLAELKQALRRVSQYYHAHGYRLARAYLPTQALAASGADVRVAILEGTLDHAKINNRSSVSTDVLQGMVSGAASDKAPLNDKDANRALLLLQETPGIGSVQGTLRPGPVVGSTVMDVDVTSAPMISGALGLDNEGNRFTGRGRFTAGLNVANPLGIGDLLSLQGTLSQRAGLNYGRVAWDAPSGPYGLRVGLAYSRTGYSLGEDFQILDAHGTAQVFALMASYPIVLMPTTHVRVAASIEGRRLDDEIGLTSTKRRRNINAAVVTLSGDFADGVFGSPAITAWRLTGTLGGLYLNGIDETTDDATAKSAGRYSKAELSLSREQILYGPLSLYLSATGQRSDKNLDSSEQLYLGGANGVRAYPLGEAPGDAGWLGTAELRLRVLPSLQLVAFEDGGMIQANRHPFVAQPNVRHLGGAGVGANLLLGPFSLESSVAWRQSDASTSDKDRRSRVWVQGRYSF